MLGLRDLDHLAARLHGRRGRLYDGARLRALFALGSVRELAKTIFPGEGIETAAGLEARLVEAFVSESWEIAACFGGVRAALLEWQAARFQLENLKSLVRSLSSGAGRKETAAALVGLPRGMDGYGRELAAIKSREELLLALPEGIFRNGLAAAFTAYPGKDAVFLIEAALERDYLAELTARAAKLGMKDRDSAGALCALETAAFNLQLAARGKFFYGFESRELLRLAAPCADREKRRFTAMLAAADIGEASEIARGLEGYSGRGEPDMAGLESLSRGRYRKAAVRALRNDHFGYGAVAAYLALRRLETADLITLTEGLRLGAGAAELEGKLLPGLEAAHV